MKKHFVFYSVIFSIFLAACDVGLGSAVDTEPPSLSITYPPAGSVIRDTFLIQGTCKDDVKIENVDVKLIKHGMSSRVVGNYNAEVDSSKGTWTITLNRSEGAYNGWELSDGDYHVEVTAYDNAKKKSGTSSLAFNIDNTAPLVILTTPGNAKPESPSEYGTDVTVNATIVDTNTVRSMTMDLVGEYTGNMDNRELSPWSEVEQKHWKEESINTAGSTKVTFAQFFNTGSSIPEEKQYLYDRYTDVYSVDTNGDKVFKVNLSTVDAAKKYDGTDSEENEIGNIADKFFFYDDVSSSWMSTAKGTDPQIVQQVINGTYEGAVFSEEQITEIKQIYTEKAQDSAVCLINKDASPKFSVNGYDAKDYLEENSSLGPVSSNATITIQAKTGRNNKPVNSKGLKAYMYGPVPTSELATKAQADVIYNAIYNDVEAAKNTYGEKLKQIYGDEAEEKKKSEASSSTLYTYNVNVDSITGGQAYLVALTGEDNDGQRLQKESYYLFIGSTSEIPPKIIWPSTKDAKNDVADRGYTNKGNLKFGGTYSSNSVLEYATYKVVVTDQGDSSKTTHTGNLTTDGSNWSLNLSSANPSINVAQNKDYTYDITISMKNNSSEKVDVSHQIYVDTKKPTLNINSISPSVLFDENQENPYINGKFKFSAEANDTGKLANVHYSIYTDQNNPGIEGDLGNVYSINKEIDTKTIANLTDNSPITIKLIATDEAGNTSELTSTQFNGGVSYFLKQDSDKPIVNPNNFNQDIINKTDIILTKDDNKTVNDVNIFDNSSNNKLNATVTDDDGLENVWVTFYKENKTTVIGQPNNLKPKGVTSYTINQPLPNEPGIYWVKISAQDKDGFPSETKLAEFFVAVDTKNPSIKETAVASEGSQFVKENGTITFTGTVDEDWEIQSVKARIAKNEIGAAAVGELKEVDITPNNEGEWTYVLNAGAEQFNNEDGDYTIDFVVLDRAGKESAVQRKVTIDKTAPKCENLTIDAVSATVNSQQVYKKNGTDTIIAYDIPSSGLWFNTSQIPIKATVSDNSGVIRSVEFSSDNVIWASMTKGANNIWTGTVNCTNQGANTYYVKVIDSAGNETSLNRTVYVDTKEPEEITNISYAIGTNALEPLTTENIFVKTGDQVKLALVVVDQGDSSQSTGIEKVYFDGINGIKNGSSYELTIPWSKISTFAEGVTPINVTIEDKVGNKRVQKLLSIQKDNEIPTAKFADLSDADDSDVLIQVNKTIVLSGTAKDNETLKSVTIQYNKNLAGADNTWTTLKKWTTSTQVGAAEPNTKYNCAYQELTNWETQLDTTTLDDKATYYFRAKVEDTAGNISYKSSDDNTVDNAITIQVDQDSDRPKVFLTTLELDPNGNTSYLRNSKSLLGNVTDDDGVKTFAYSFDGTNYTNVTLGSGGAWNITVNNEGENEIYFKITDKKDKVFVSASAAVADKPKITDGTTTISNTSDCVLRFNLVTQNPESKDWKYSVYNSKENKWSEFSMDLGTIGGVYTKVKVQVSAKSANEIETITGKFSESEFNFTKANPATYNATGFNVWEAVIENIENCPSGTNTNILESKIIDKAGMETIQSINVAVDNTKPDIKFVNPPSMVRTEETIRGTMNETVTLYYAVSKYNANEDNVHPDSHNLPISTDWVELQDKDSANNWYVYFDGVGGTDHTEKFARYLTEDYLAFTTQAAIDRDENPFDTPTDVYFWIKAVDEVGNTQIESLKLTVDPQGERPIIELEYPDVTNGNVPTLGGTIRLSGTAEDNKGADFVWIQIDSDDVDGFGLADLQKLLDNGYIIGNIDTKQVVTSMAGINNSNVTRYAIKTNVRGSSWNESINKNREFNPDEEIGGLAVLKLTIISSDSDGNYSIPQTYTINIDANNPYEDKDAFELVQYIKADGSICTDGSVSSGTVGARVTYTTDMSIKGIWYLRGGFIDDDSGIKEITYNKTKVITVTNQTYNSNGIIFTPRAETKAGKTIYQYEFQVPVGSIDNDAVGTSTAEFSIVENTEEELYLDISYSVIYDNKKPVISLDSNNAYVKLEQSVRNSNGFYTFGSIASEDDVSNVAQSGIERVAFYFTRDLEYNLRNKNASTYNEHPAGAANTRDLFDVMIYRSGTESQDVASGNTIIGYQNNSNYVLEDGIYWKKVNGTIQDNQFTYTGTQDKNIHSKGIVKVNGSIYLIDNISGNDITLSGNAGSNTPTSVIAYFGMCNVIDNSGEKNSGKTSSTQGYGYGYYPSRQMDDGDLITETFNKQGTNWFFDASVNSKNLPDGPITVHIIAFDKAGNTAEYHYSGVVSNNAPRIAGMKIGTDENGNGTVDESEFITTYSQKYESGYDGETAIDNVTFPSQVTNNALSLLTIKGKTVVKPEIIGGNGEVKYTYSVYNHVSDVTWSEVASYTKAEATIIGTGTTDDIMVATPIELPLTDFIGKTNGSDTRQIDDGLNKKFTFNFGDSTPGLALDSGVSNNASIDVIMNVALRETNKPHSWIFPFYWKNSTDNSLFKQSKENGHIELSKDLPATFANGNAGVMTRRPKVSGKIKIEGIAQDDTLLKQIGVKFNKQFATKAASAETVIATYNAGTGSWTIPSTLVSDDIPQANGWAAEIKQATYGQLMSVGIITEIPEGKEATDKVPYNSQDYGHVVHWIMYVDSAKIQNVAALDVQSTVKASDRGTPTWNSATNSVVYTSNGSVVSGAGQSGGINGTDAMTGLYSMDIVPYIVGINTVLSEQDEQNPSVFARSALGTYAIPSKNEDGGNETVVFVGFNLIGARLNGNALLGSNATEVVEYYNNASYSYAKLEITNAITSGAKELTVNGVRTLNNINNNDAKGSFDGTLNQTNYVDYAYNRQPNDDNNNLLTDDINLAIWEFDPEAAIPLSGKIEQPVMKIHPTTGRIGFAFVNGPLYFSMPGANNSYDFWMGSYDFFTSVGMTYDSLGNSYAVAAGGDINSNAADKFQFMTSKWGRASRAQDGSYGSTNSLRLESIGQKDASNTNLFDKQRIKSPSLTTLVKGTNTIVYLAYYDAMNDEIRFKSGQVTNTKNNFGSFRDYDTEEPPYAYRNRYVGRIAGNGTTNNAGEYVSIGVASGGVDTNGIVVAVWYDATARTLKYSYNTDPLNSDENGQYANWSEAQSIFTGKLSRAGEYCKIHVDQDNGIHIVAYDSKNLDLVYAYAPSYNGTFETCVVDSNGVVGSNLTLDVVKVGTNWVPYIGYYATSCIKPKYAYKVNTSVNAPSGAVSDRFTQAWECMVVPTSSVVQMQSNQHNDINIGLWKTEEGTIKNSNTGEKVKPTKGGGYNSTKVGSVYGNGTSNAVLGYAVKAGASTDAIETAQIR